MAATRPPEQNRPVNTSTVEFPQQTHDFLRSTITEAARLGTPYPMTQGWFLFLKVNTSRGNEGKLPWQQIASTIAQEGVNVLGNEYRYEKGSGFHEFLRTGIEIAHEMELVENVLSSFATHIPVDQLPTEKLVGLLFHPQRHNDERSHERIVNIFRRDFGLQHADRVVSDFFNAVVGKQAELLKTIPAPQENGEYEPQMYWNVLGVTAVHDKIKTLAKHNEVYSIAQLITGIYEVFDIEKGKFDFKAASDIACDYNLTRTDMEELVSEVFIKTDHPIGLLEFALICQQKQWKKVNAEMNREVEV